MMETGQQQNHLLTSGYLTSEHSGGVANACDFVKNLVLFNLLLTFLLAGTKR